MQNPHDKHGHPVKVSSAVFPDVGASEEQLHQSSTESKVRDERTLQGKLLSCLHDFCRQESSFNLLVETLALLGREYSTLSSQIYHSRTTPTLIFPEKLVRVEGVETSVLMTRSWE